MNRRLTSKSIAFRNTNGFLNAILGEKCSKLLTEQSMAVLLPFAYKVSESLSPCHPPECTNLVKERKLEAGKGNGGLSQQKPERKTRNKGLGWSRRKERENE